MEKKLLKVGVIGCGNISTIYLQNLGKSSIVRVIAVADLVREKAEEQAKKFNIPAVLSAGELLKHPDIDIVLNITLPAVHGKIALEALRRGKHVYNEKPLALGLSEARAMVALGRSKNLRIGCAPDTFLGGGWQLAREKVDQGILGKIVGGTGFMISRGPEKWHPAPEFFYKKGAGPLFDMGPYYITALISLLGPVKKVSGAARISYPVRTILSRPLYGKKIKVEVPTHVCGVLEFSSGPVVTLTTSFDAVRSDLPNLELFGENGSLRLPDPNCFSGPLTVWDGDKETKTVKHAGLFQDNSRGLGLVDMAVALRKGKPHRANGAMALHVLEVMHSMLKAGSIGKAVLLSSTCDRPARLPAESKTWFK